MWIILAILWVAFLIVHPWATIFITALVVTVIAASTAGGKQGDGSSHHGGRWLS